MSGLRDFSSALDNLEPEVAADLKRALFQIGMGVVRARGPYGQQISAESQMHLLLLAELLDLGSAP